MSAPSPTWAYKLYVRVKATLSSCDYYYYYYNNNFFCRIALYGNGNTVIAAAPVEVYLVPSIIDTIDGNKWGWVMLNVTSRRFSPISTDLMATHLVSIMLYCFCESILIVLIVLLFISLPITQIDDKYVAMSCAKAAWNYGALEDNTDSHYDPAEAWW